MKGSFRRASWFAALLLMLSMMALPRPSSAMGPIREPYPPEPRFGDPDGPSTGPRYMKIGFLLPTFGRFVFVEIKGFPGSGIAYRILRLEISVR